MMKRYYLAILLIFSFLLFQPMLGGQQTSQEYEVEIVQNQSVDSNCGEVFILQVDIITYQTEYKIGQAGNVLGKSTSISYDVYLQPINSSSMEHLKYAIGWQSELESPKCNNYDYKGQNHYLNKNIVMSTNSLKVIKLPILAV